MGLGPKPGSYTRDRDARRARIRARGQGEQMDWIHAQAAGKAPARPVLDASLRVKRKAPPPDGAA